MAKTALELSREEWRKYKPWQNLHKFQDLQRWQQAWDVAQELAKLLRTDFDATRVVVFGSVAQKESKSSFLD